MRRHWVAQLLFVNSIVAVGVAHAAAITVINPSFETFNPLTVDCSVGSAGCAYNVSGVPGWTSTGITGSWQPGAVPSIFLNFLPDGPTSVYSLDNSSLTQTVAQTAVAGITYTLKVEIGNRKDQPPGGYAQLLIGGNTIAATGGPIAEGGWTTFTAMYTALPGDAGQAISIRLGSIARQGNFDNVRLTEVPEPGTVALMGAGLAGVALARRRRRR